MIFQNLGSGRFIGRRKRFFADIELSNGETTIAHCPNTGSMRSLLMPGSTAFFSYSDNPNRKLATTLELLKLPDSTLAFVDTIKVNAIVEEGLEQGLLFPQSEIKQIKREVLYHAGTRFDFTLTTKSSPKPIWIEVKSVTLSEKPGIASFPDAVTTRGQKHLQELADLARQGESAHLIYLITRSDCEQFEVAHYLDIKYAEFFQKAIQAGVKVHYWRVDFKQENTDWTLTPRLAYGPQ